MTKEEVIAALLKCATNLGRVPSREELMNHGVSRRDLRRNFGTLRQALRECKLERASGHRKVEMENLFHDWARVARSLKKLPTMKEYGRLGQYSVRPLRTRFVSWNYVPVGLKRFAEASGQLAEEWKDVLALVNDTREPQPASPLTFAGPFAQTMPGQPTYGAPIQCGALVFAPTNEFGVLFLFGAIADRLGFLVLRVQAEFPDIEALRMVGRDKLQRVRVELEQESRNFLKHGHDPNGCDLIVCWEHNWDECPLEVIELRTVIAKIGNAKALTTKDTKGGEIGTSGHREIWGSGKQEPHH